MSDRSFPHSASRFPTPTVLDLPVHAKVTARALLILNLRAIHKAGREDEEVHPVLLLDPESATAAAYRFGVHAMAFDLDDILGVTGSDRHLLHDTDPEHTVEFLETTGGSGESHEDNADVLDNRDMVGVAV